MSDRDPVVDPSTDDAAASSDPSSSASPSSTSEPKKKRRVLRIVLALFALVLLIPIGVSGYAYVATQGRINATWDVEPAITSVPDDAEAIARGEHIGTSVMPCVDCHGEDMGGGPVIEAPAFVGSVYAPNLTSGQGSVVADYDDADWFRALRHAVGPDGRALVLMPSYEIAELSLEDTAALIAWVKSLPAVDREDQGVSLGPLLRLTLLGEGGAAFLPAEMIDHDATPPAHLEPAPTAEYGERIAAGCKGCHGQGLSGGPIPGTPPDWPPPPNITPHDSGIADWSREDFVGALQRGERPDGTALNTRYMPWERYAGLTEVEVEALWAYMQSVEPREAGTR